MPVYRYEVKAGVAGCTSCSDGFEVTQSIYDARLETCPQCGAAIVKTPVISSLGRSEAALDDRAKAAGFTKLKRLGEGEYEKQY